MPGRFLIFPSATRFRRSSLLPASGISTNESAKRPPCNRRLRQSFAAFRQGTRFFGRSAQCRSALRFNALRGAGSFRISLPSNEYGLLCRRTHEERRAYCSRRRLRVRGSFLRALDPCALTSCSTKIAVIPEDREFPPECYVAPFTGN